MDFSSHSLGRRNSSENSPTNNRLNHTFSSKLSSISDSTSQSFSSILNNPNNQSSSSISSWWSSNSTIQQPEFAPFPTHLPKPGSELTLATFQPYLSKISDTHSHFVDILRQNERDNPFSSSESPSLAGEALVACLREVPALFFEPGFELEDGGTFKAACPFRTGLENVALQEKLSGYLDVVEVHLVREISLRSGSFYEAQVELVDLNERIVEGCGRVGELKGTIRDLETELVGKARRVQELSRKRGDLVALQNKLMLVLSVNQAVSTLQLLVSSADCVGALDIIDDLQHLLDGDELIGLHCFRHLRDRIAASIESINSILSAEFIRASLHGAGNISTVAPTSISNGSISDVRQEEDRTSNLQDQLLPLVIGLLRTGKLPAILRIYRDTLASDLKTSIKTTVLSMPLDSDSIFGEGTGDADGGGSSLGSKLRNVSPDGFLKLLEEIFRIVQTRLLRAYDVKRAIEWIMGNLTGHYAAASVAAAIAHGADATHDSDGHVSPLLQQTSQNSTRYDAASPNLSRNFRADILRENAEALFAACDTAHGRWAKIVAIRSQIHPRLRLQDFLSVYNITQEFISSTERIGGRLGYSLRGTLQSQAKSFIDFQHESRMTKMRALLDQENWAEVDVPEEFQAIIDLLFVSESVSIEENHTVIDKIASSSDGEQPDSNGISVDNTSNTDGAVGVTTENMSSDGGTSAHANNASTNRGKNSLRMLYFREVGYHMVNCGLYLVKMMSEYIEMNSFLHALSPQIVNHVAEILKLFNSRTAHLVLGANALQVSGLKSITARHLAMASQVISFTHAIIPEIRKILLLKVPETYKGLLQLELDRVATDYKNHRDEIHSKLVQIMRERLHVHLRSLPQIAEGWNRSVDSSDLQPSQFARSLTKEVGYLQRTLSKHLLEEDVQTIFGQVVVILHTQISDAFSRLELSSLHAKNSLQCDVQHLLGCIRSLPSDNSSKATQPNWGQLDEFLTQNFGAESVV